MTLSDRNGGKSKVIPEEVEKRRSLFWELLYLDARLVGKRLLVFQIRANQFCSHYRWADRPHSPLITWIALGRRTPRTRDAIPQKVCITVSVLLQPIN